MPLAIVPAQQRLPRFSERSEFVPGLARSGGHLGPVDRLHRGRLAAGGADQMGLTRGLSQYLRSDPRVFRLALSSRVPRYRRLALAPGPARQPWDRSPRCAGLKGPKGLEGPKWDRAG